MRRGERDDIGTRRCIDSEKVGPCDRYTDGGERRRGVFAQVESERLEIENIELEARPRPVSINMMLNIC